MRILFCTRPAFGHVYPVLPLALAARDAGHEVHVSSAGDFVARIAAIGLRAHRAGPTFAEAFDALRASDYPNGLPTDASGRPDPDAAGSLFVDVIGRPTAADLTGLLADLAPDLVVYGDMDRGAPIAAAAAGIPAVCHLVSPVMPSNVLDGMAGDRLASFAADYDVDPELVPWYGTHHVDIFPSVLRPPDAPELPGRIPLRPTPFRQPDAYVPNWVAVSQRPLVYLTLGTVVSGDAVLAPAIAGLASVDADVLVALGSAAGEDLGDLPANVHVERFVDQAAVLRRASLAVHHGGSGTTLDALACGVPQLILPKGADQFLNADLMGNAGLAAVLEPAAATPAAIARAATGAIGALPPAAAAVRDEIAALPDPYQALEELVDVAASGRPTTGAAAR